MKTTKKIYRVWWRDFECTAEFENCGKALTFLNSRHLKRMNNGQEAEFFIDEVPLDYKPFNKIIKNP